jgi:hypothetical protein
LLGGQTGGGSLALPDRGEPMTIQHICCKKSSGGFSICEPYSSTRQTLNAMQMLLSVGMYLM